MILNHKTQSFLLSLQNEICAGLKKADGKGIFHEDAWMRTEGGGGITRILENGNVFEKAGVNTSTVFGKLPELVAKKMNVPSADFFATGISLVVHPASPMIPTVHMNIRYFEQANDTWFGGGIDLTPYYLFEDDAKHFHQALKDVCDKHDNTYYPRFKKWCDEYFFIKHRGETRGIGGIFFDYQRGTKQELEKFFLFWKEIGATFLSAYLPIVEKRRSETYTEAEKQFQLLRRGRYAEFNLVYDRGTLFGLETNGRVESILMSLPPQALWKYDFHPEAGSREAKLTEILKHPREWV